MKNRYLKWIGRGFLCMAAAVLIAAIAFYFIELKPRIDVALLIGRAFSDGADEGDILELDLKDGQQILLDIGSDSQLDGVVYKENAAYDGLEFGYMQQGIWMRFPKVSSNYYLLPWTDDVQEQIDESALIALLQLNEEQKEALGTGILGLRGHLLAEEDYEFRPTWLNHLLGLDCLKADILDLYNGISFHKTGRQEISHGDEVLSCTKYEIGIPEEYVRPLLKTDGAGRVLETLGDMLGDVTLEVYVYQGALVYIDIDTSFLYMPQVEWKDMLTGNPENILQKIKLSPVPIKGEISINAEGSMEIEAQLISDQLHMETTLTWKLLDQQSSWKYDSSAALNIFQTGYFRLLLEAKKWEEALNGKGTD